jgi:small subunit ribosomal protein S16
MVVIRLQRRGTKKIPHHRIVATDRTRSQGGRVLETIGYYNPSYEPPRFSLDESRLTFWVSSGAQVSAAVDRLVKRHKKLSAASIKS